MPYALTIQLASDATFGSGQGSAGVVDSEIDLDVDGLPCIRGRRLKGLLVEECAGIRHSLNAICGDDGETWQERWEESARCLFGLTTPLGDRDIVLHFGDARLPHELRAGLAAAREEDRPSREEVLAALTTIRRQTSIDAATGAYARGSLRAARALVRGLTLIAPLDFAREPKERERALLAACALATRRGGIARQRGRGQLRLLLHAGDEATLTDYEDDAFTRQCFTTFAREVRHAGARV